MTDGDERSYFLGCTEAPQQCNLSGAYATDLATAVQQVWNCTQLTLTGGTGQVKRTGKPAGAPRAVNRPPPHVCKAASVRARHAADSEPRTRGV